MSLATDLGLTPRPAPLRRWVQSPNAGHLSGLVWGSSKSEVVLVHDLGDSSNGWDAVAIASRRDLVALDLAGHGRSSAADAVASPARQSPSLIDAVRSLAPTARLIVASGYGAAVVLQAAIKRPASFRALLIVDGGTVASGTGPLVDAAGLDSIDAAADRIAAAAPRRPPALVRHLAAETTVAGPAGRLEWRYQLGHPPANSDAWLSVEHFGDPPTQIGVVTASNAEPIDPLVGSVLRRWPDTARLVLTDVPPGVTDDLVASAPAAVASAIDRFLLTLDNQP